MKTTFTLSQVLFDIKGYNGLTNIHNNGICKNQSLYFDYKEFIGYQYYYQLDFVYILF